MRDSAVLRSAPAPVDVVPVANDGQNQQEESDQQQPGSFGRIGRVAMLLVGVGGFGGSDHEDIVALSPFTNTNHHRGPKGVTCYTTASCPRRKTAAECCDSEYLKPTFERKSYAKAALNFA